MKVIAALTLLVLSIAMFAFGTMVSDGSIAVSFMAPHSDLLTLLFIVALGVLIAAAMFGLARFVKDV